VPLVVEQAPMSRLVRFVLALAGEPRKLTQAASLRLKLGRTRYLDACWPLATEPGAVTLRQRAKTWREPCDYLACGFGLVPNIELPVLAGCELRDGFVAVDEWQETSVAGVYCAGEPTGIGGLDAALVEGRIAGYAASGNKEHARALFLERARTRAFQQALDRAFVLADELKALAAAGTVVCRCEDVTMGRIREQHSWRSAKLQTRCGMGPCQGRVCGPAIEFILGWTPDSVRPPVFPGRLEDLASGASLEHRPT